MIAVDWPLNTSYADAIADSVTQVAPARGLDFGGSLTSSRTLMCIFAGMFQAAQGKAWALCQFGLSASVSSYESELVAHKLVAHKVLSRDEYLWRQTLSQVLSNRRQNFWAFVPRALVSV